MTIKKVLRDRVLHGVATGGGSGKIYPTSLPSSTRGHSGEGSTLLGETRRGANMVWRNDCDASW